LLLDLPRSEALSLCMPMDGIKLGAVAEPPSSTKDAQRRICRLLASKSGGSVVEVDASLTQRAG
jgi:hypothetical protein